MLLLMQVLLLLLQVLVLLQLMPLLRKSRNVHHQSPSPAPNAVTAVRTPAPPAEDGQRAQAHEAGRASHLNPALGRAMLLLSAAAAQCEHTATTQDVLTEKQETGHTTPAHAVREAAQGQVY